VEGFCTSWFNKRTASRPSPHPIGLQSCCSTLLCSPPPGLCQAPVLHQIHAPPGSLPLRPCWAPAPSQIHTLLGSPPRGSPSPQDLHGSSSTCNNQSHTLPGSLPLSHAGPKLHARTTPHQDPQTLGPARFLLCQDPHPYGQASAQQETATSLSPLGSLSLGWSWAPALQAYQITAPPISHSGHY
jgi:hypothetical protein